MQVNKISTNSYNPSFKSVCPTSALRQALANNLDIMTKEQGFSKPQVLETAQKVKKHIAEMMSWDKGTKHNLDYYRAWSVKRFKGTLNEEIEATTKYGIGKIPDSLYDIKPAKEVAELSPISGLTWVCRLGIQSGIKQEDRIVVKELLGKNFVDGFLAFSKEKYLKIREKSFDKFFESYDREFIYENILSRSKKMGEDSGKLFIKKFFGK